MEKEAAEQKGIEVNGLSYWRQTVYAIILKSKKDELERHKLLQQLAETQHNNTTSVLLLERELELTCNAKKQQEATVEGLQTDISALEMKNQNLSSLASQATTIVPLLQAFPDAVDSWANALNQYLDQLTSLAERIKELDAQVLTIQREQFKFVLRVNELKKSLNQKLAKEREYRDNLETRCDELHRALTEEEHRREESEGLNERLYQEHTEEMHSLQTEMQHETEKLKSEIKRITNERDQLHLIIRKLKIELRTSQIAQEQLAKSNGKELERISQLELQLQRREKLLEKIRSERDQPIETFQRHGFSSSPSITSLLPPLAQPFEHLQSIQSPSQVFETKESLHETNH
jgi:hypothetical protein